LAAVIHLDTHVLVWLYAGELQRLSAAGRDLIERERLAISPMVSLELTYLYEVGRIRVPAAAVIDELVPRLELQPAASSFATVVQHAQTLTWTRDPFDRLIAGHALADDAGLLTADETLLAHLPVAVSPS
jgi:PIN domain nuclease of toxin-antitoxin system